MLIGKRKMQKQSIQISLLFAILLVTATACATADPVPAEAEVPPAIATESKSTESTTSEASSAEVVEPVGEFSLAGMEKNANGYIDLSVEQLATVLPDKDFTLVNVHVPDQGNLPMTDLSIAFDEVDAFVAALPDKDAPIVIYCRSGGMSSQMAPALAALGYTNLFELEGGFNAWGAAGYELLPPQ